MCLLAQSEAGTQAAKQESGQILKCEHNTNKCASYWDWRIPHADGGGTLTEQRAAGAWHDSLTGRRYHICGRQGRVVDWVVMVSMLQRNTHKHTHSN